MEAGTATGAMSYVSVATSNERSYPILMLLSRYLGLHQRSHTGSPAELHATSWLAPVCQCHVVAPEMLV